MRNSSPITLFLYITGIILFFNGCRAEPKGPGLETTTIDPEQSWQDILHERLPELGHRNWIVVADAAYPKQSAPGIETIYTGANQMEVLEQVLRAIDSTAHIKPIVMFDKELQSVTDESAPGVVSYRNALESLLSKTPSTVLPHEDIIRKLDKASELFNILLLKSDMTIPYTSVFIELDCGYWNAEKEAELRNSIDASDVSGQ